MTVDIHVKCELSKPVVIRHLDGMVFSQDAMANRIVVSVTRGGVPEELPGNISANIIRADGATVVQTGEVSGNVATVTLPASAYAVSGAIAIIIKSSESDITTTIAAVTGYVYRSTTDTIVDPGTVVPNLAELLAQIGDCRTATSAAQAVADKLDNMTAAASGLAAGAAPTVTVSDVNGHKHLAFGIPKGDKGDTGATGAQGPKGDTGYPTDAQVAEAVDDWLTDHPEATTTVQDGSLTEVKLTAATQLKVLNNYATPEMFGAKGDGTTDDAEAINAMFASDYNVFSFGNKTYLTNDAVTCEKTCTIYFDHTTILAKKSYGLRDFEYVIAFKAPRIRTFGTLKVLANTSVNIGVWLATIGGSHFDALDINNARIWGLYIDETTNGNNSLKINTLSASQCGSKAHGKAKRTDSTHLEITDISGWFTGYADDIRPGLFDNSYGQANLVIDDSLYQYSNDIKRFVFFSNEKPAFTLDEEDISKATFYVNTSGPRVPSDYTQNDETRDVFIPIGGGVHMSSRNSEGVYHIQNLVTQSNPMSSYISLGYGGNIGNYASEYDTIVMHNESLRTIIGYTYFEAVGSGYVSTFGDARDRIYVFAQTSNIRIYLENPFVGASRLPVHTGNVIINYRQGNIEAEVYDQYFGCPNFFATKIHGINALTVNGTGGIALPNDILDEYSPRNITIDTYGVTGGSKIKLDLREKNITNKTNSFDPVTIYLRRRRENSDYDSFQITLTNDMISAGYTIDGAVDNVFTVHPSEYGNFVKVTIMLFRYDSKFFVKAEPLLADSEYTTNLVTTLSSSSTDAQYPSAKCVYDLLGDVESLLSGI